MSETMSCPNCSATLPAGASFCTSCGNRIDAAGGTAAAEPPPPAPSAPPEDATRVDNPGLHDSTQVFTPPAPAYQPPAAPAYQPPPPAAPWQPADAAPGAPAAPAPPAWSAPPAAPAAAPPPWQQPQQAPPTQGWGEPPAAAQWGAPGAAPSSPGSSGASPLGGLAALVGGALVLVGLFTAWIGSNKTSDTITGWQLATDDKIPFESNDPYVLLALGIIALLIGIALFTGKARPLMRIAAVVVGVAVIGVMVRDWLSIVDVVKDVPDNTLKVSQKFGYFLGIAGGVVTAVAAVLPGKKASA